MKVLVVGAGATGQVFGRHLSLGGAEVHVLVKPAHREEARVGYAMYPLNKPAPRVAPVRWWPDQVHTQLDSEGIVPYDLVLLCLPSNALRGGWLHKLLRRSGQATVVLLTAALGDRELLLEHLPSFQLVQGLVSAVAYAGPLPGESLPLPGTVYWFPPGAHTRFAGPSARVRQVVDALAAGGLPAVEAKGEERISAATGAVVMPHLVALECAGWSLEGVREEPWLHLAHRAAEEAEAVVAAVEGRPHAGHPPPAALVRVLTGLPAALLPFPLQPYLAQHFSKLKCQTLLDMKRIIAAGEERGLSVASLRALLQMRQDGQVFSAWKARQGVPIPA